MTDSHRDYEAEIRELMDTLSGEETAPKAEPETPERKNTVRLSTAPIATSLGDLPLILGTVPYEPSGTSDHSEPTDSFELIMPTDGMMGERHEDDFSDSEFARHYHHTQQADREAGGYDDARRASIIGRYLFRRGDSFAQVMRKGAFWLAAAVLVAVLGYGVYVLGVRPLIAAYQEKQIVDSYDPDAEGTVGEQESGYPQGMLASFRGLYDINPHVCGYIRYHADAEQDFLQVDYPVVFASDNTAYENTNFYGDASADGALYLDERCGDEDAAIRVIYGKNAANGRMFAGLNSLVGSVYNARAAATLTYSTLYEKSEYQVFAVVLTDESASGDRAFNSCRTDFATDAEFAAHIEAVKARSLFDYNVPVSSTDDVLVLVTDASQSVAKIGNARIAVFARRVEGDVPSSLIVKNTDVVMPYAWYTAQNMTPHSYYSRPGSTTAAPTTGTAAPSATTTTTGTAAPSDGATTTTAASTTTTTTQPTQPASGGDDGVIDFG